jgi:hypothetical protein
MTREAFMQVYEIFAPDFARRMRQHPPAADRASSAD